MTSSTLSRRILVVDDNLDAAESLSELLSLDDHVVTLAHDGPSALRLAAETPPEVMLLDIGLPGMNGYEVARLVRQAEWGRAVLLVAVTGWGHEDDKRSALAAGFDHHLTKPIDFDALNKVVMQRPVPRA